MPTAYDELKRRYEAAHILDTAEALLVWDERVMMPPGSGAERAGMHRILNDATRHYYLAPGTLKPLLQEAQADMHKLDDWDKINLQQMINAHDDPPLDIVPNLRVDLRNAESLCRQIWPAAKTSNDWHILAGPFGQLIYYRRLLNAAVAAVRSEHTPYDVSLSVYSRGLRTKLFDQITDTLLPQLQQFLQGYTLPNGPSPTVAQLAIAPATQMTLMRNVISTMGFNFNQGRLDTSLKAFFEKTDQDRRIVTAIDPSNFLAGLSSAIHEAGHALHYQYLPDAWRSQPVGRAGDYCMREAMAFIWQIFVAQTPEFHVYLAEQLQDTAGLTINPAEIHAAQNAIRPSPVRIGSDPATYALHILIRYRIERDLINNVQDVQTLPDRWAAEYLSALGVVVPDAAHGVVQDIHWYKGSFGYFPCYLMALLYAAQLFNKARTAIPGLVSGFAQGRFTPLTQWLETHIYSQANLHDGLTLLEQATGEPLNPAYFMDYLRQRYSPPA